MAGLVPAIHVLLAVVHKDVDARDEPGHDEKFHHRTGWQVIRPAIPPDFE